MPVSEEKEILNQWCKLKLQEVNNKKQFKSKVKVCKLEY